jgi:hypothetical protein
MVVLPTSEEEAKVDQNPRVHERRLNMRLMSYWRDLRGEGLYAPAVRFDPEVLADVWTHCFMVVPADKPEKARLDHIGTVLAADSGVAGEALAACDVPANTLLGNALRLVAEVMTIRYPIVDSGEFTDDRGRHCLYRCILLPLSGAGESISLLVGGASGRFARPEV